MKFYILAAGNHIMALIDMILYCIFPVGVSNSTISLGFFNSIALPNGEIIETSQNSTPFSNALTSSLLTLKLWIKPL